MDPVFAFGLAKYMLVARSLEGRKTHSLSVPSILSDILEMFNCFEI